MAIRLARAVRPVLAVEHTGAGGAAVVGAVAGMGIASAGGVVVVVAAVGVGGEAGDVEGA